MRDLRYIVRILSAARDSRVKTPRGRVLTSLLNDLNPGTNYLGLPRILLEFDLSSQFLGFNYIHNPGKINSNNKKHNYESQYLLHLTFALTTVL